MMEIKWVTGASFICLNKDGTLVINYDRWMELSTEERKFMLQHERLHEMMRRNEIETGF